MNVVFASNSIPSYQLKWAIISGGGGMGMLKSDRYAIQNTIGQVSISSSIDQSYKLDHGFWYGISITHEFYLPVALRDH